MLRHVKSAGYSQTSGKFGLNVQPSPKNGCWIPPISRNQLTPWRQERRVRWILGSTKRRERRSGTLWKFWYHNGARLKPEDASRCPQRLGIFAEEHRVHRLGDRLELA